MGSRIDNVENEVRSLQTRIDAVGAGLGARIDAVETGLRQEIRENYHLLDERIRSTETGFARIDQRLETLERAVIPSAEPPE